MPNSWYCSPLLKVHRGCEVTAGTREHDGTAEQFREKHDSGEKPKRLIQVSEVGAEREK